MHTLLMCTGFFLKLLSLLQLYIVQLVRQNIILVRKKVASRNETKQTTDQHS